MFFRSCVCYAFARLFICALWSPAGKGLTSWLSFVVSNCKFVTLPLVSWVRCGTWLYRFLIFAPLLTFMNWNETIYFLYCAFFWWGFTPLGQTSDSMTVLTSILIYWWDSRSLMLWLFVGPTGIYLLDFFSCSIQFYLLLSPFLCFISL